MNLMNNSGIYFRKNFYDIQAFLLKLHLKKVVQTNAVHLFEKQGETRCEIKVACTGHVSYAPPPPPPYDV